MELQHVDTGLICVVSVDIDKDVEPAFEVWYEKHIRDVVGCDGWVRATRYRCLDGEPRYLAIYDIESADQAAIGSVANWPKEMQRIQQAGYEEFWPHIEGYKARNYERISRVVAATSPREA